MQLPMELCAAFCIRTKPLLERLATMSLKWHSQYARVLSISTNAATGAVNWNSKPLER